MSAEELITWVRSNRGYLHKGVAIAHDGTKGHHFTAKEDLPDGTHVLHVPHTVALSCLNAMVDDSIPALKSNADSFTVEALGVFYLMSQWINREKSFWKPYLDMLPTPEEDLGTPFWYSEEDLQWLEGTDLKLSFEKRDEVWRDYWRDGIAILASSGMDVSQYTWDLCKWAATIFTSRSFTSRSVRPIDSKYWTAYKQGPSGRQTVLLDFSNIPETRKDFPVLIPLMDMLNHDPNGEVQWAFEPGRFSLSLHGAIPTGSEISNNYGPKSNSELLLGYGFCLPDNPHDCIYEALRPPPSDLVPALRVYQPGYFTTTTTTGEWNTEAATFRLSLPPRSPADVWTAVPLSLLELLYHLTLHERGLPLTPLEGDMARFLLRGDGARTLPRIAYTLVSSLLPKLEKLRVSGEGLGVPRGRHQEMAGVYRDSQVRILMGLRAGLMGFVRGFRPASSPDPGEVGSVLLTLQEVVSAVKGWDGGYARQLEMGLCAVFQSGALEGIEGDAEPYAWALALCFVASLQLFLDGKDQELGETRGRAWVLGRHVTGLVGEYGSEEYGREGTEGEAGTGVGKEEQMVEEAESAEGERLLAGIVDAGVMVDRDVTEGEELARQVNVWREVRWSERFVMDWGLRIARSQGMKMMVGDGEVRYVVYLHASD